jgi:PAS domain S-box-containing protein
MKYSHTREPGKYIGALVVIIFLLQLPALYFWGSSDAFEHPILLAFLNTIFLGIIPLGAAFYAAKSYEGSGDLALLATGCGYVFFATSNLFGGWVMVLTGDANSMVTITNLGSLLAGVFQFVGALYFFYGTGAALKPFKKFPRSELIYGSIGLFLVAILLLAHDQKLPFFIGVHNDSSLLRNVVLGGSICLFGMTGFLNLKNFGKTHSEYSYWSGLALWLIAIGLLSLLKSPVVASASCWLGWAAQYVACVYLVFAFMHNGDVDTTALAQLSAALKREMGKRAQTENALIENEQRFQRIAENAQSLIYRYELSPRREFTYVSASATSMTGYTPEEHYSDPDLGFKMVLPEDRHLLENVFLSREAHHKPLELRWVRKDGSVFWAEQRNVAHFDANENLLAIEGIANDISDRRRSELALFESEAKLRLILGSLTDSVIMLDAMGCIQYVNHVPPGLDEKELPGTNWLNWVLAEDRTRASVSLRQTVEKGLSAEIEYRVIGLEQKATWLRVKSARMPDDSVQKVVLIASDITQTRWVEEELRQSEARYHSLFDDSPIALWEEDFSLVKREIDRLRRAGVTDFKKYWQDNPEEISGLPGLVKIIEINKASANMLGMRGKDLISEHLSDYLTDESMQMIQEEITTLAEGKTQFKFQLPLLNIKKEKLIFDLNLIVHPAYVDSLERVLVSFIDVTEQKKAEAELQQATERLSLSQRSSKSGLWDWDFLTGRLIWTHELFELFDSQYLPSLSLEDWLEFVHLDDRQITKDAINKAILEHKPLVIEYQIVLSSGEIRWMSALGDTTYDQAGQPQRMSGICIDITERKVSTEALRASEERFRGYFEQDLIGVAVTSPEKGWLDANVATCRLLGYSKDELTTKSWAELTYPDDLDLDLGYFGQVMRGEIDGYRLEKRFIRADGVVIYVDLSVRCRRYPSGGVEYFMALLSDISERKNAEAELLRYRDHLELLVKERTAQLEVARDQAEIANREKSEFLAVMSHEIRTPMNGVLGLTHLALQNTVNNKMREYLTHIQSSGELLLAIINDILDFSKIEAGKMVLENTNFNLDEIINSLINMVAYRAQEKGLELVFNIAPDVPRLLVGDPSRLRQIILNLVGNAIKFTEQGEVVFKALLLEKAGLNGEMAVIEFSARDTGIGMDEDQIINLFQPFSQADSSTNRKYGGTGLGLVISQRLIKLMGGDIRVESEPGRGSNFTFGVQLACQDPAFDQSLNIPSEINGLCALVVDDNSESLECIINSLQAFTFQVTPALSAGEALELLSAAVVPHFDLLLIDQNLDGALDGVQTISKIRSIASYAYLPAILFVQPASKARAKDYAGVDEVLMKPITASVLYDAIMDVFKYGARTHAIRKEKAHFFEKMESVRGSHLLLVEDNEINQMVAKELLENMGMVISIANDGQEAVEMVVNGSFAAVLMDIQMPGMDGYTATVRIRSDPRFGFDSLPIIAMTAHALKGDREKALAVGANDYLTKPIDINLLGLALLRWLKQGKPGEVILKNPDKESSIPPREVNKSGKLLKLDKPEALLRLGGNQDLYDRLLVMTRSNHAHTASDIRLAIQVNDISGANRLAHTLKGVAGTIGATELQAATRELELALASQDVAVFESLLQKVELLLAQLLEGLE